MRNHVDRVYYSRRSDEEIAGGDTAVDSTVAAIHYELPCRYAVLAASGRRKSFELTVIEGGKVESAGERLESQLRAQRN